MTKKDEPTVKKFETVKVQAKWKGAKIETRLDCKDQSDRSVQGHVFEMEIARDQLTETEFLELERCFDGNPIQVKMYKRDRSMLVQFSTVVCKFTRTVRTGDQNEQIKVLVVKITAFNDKRFDVDKLHTLQLEELVYMEFLRYTPEMGEFAEPAAHKARTSGGRGRKPKDDTQGEIGLTGESGGKKK